MPIDARVARAMIAAAVLGATAAGAQPQTASEPEPPARERERSEAPAEAGGRQAGDKGVAAPSEPFVPSESISADSVVSFPVDI